MKTILFSIALSFSFIINAQQLEQKIPANVEAVISVNGNRLLELMSIAEFDKSDIAKEIFKKLNKQQKSDTLKSLKDFGFDLNSKAYYFFQQTDSIVYHSLLVKLNNRNLFEDLLKKSEKEKIETVGKRKILVSNSKITTWNDNMLLFTRSYSSHSYFNKNEARFLEFAKEGEVIDEVKTRFFQKWTKDFTTNIFNSNLSESILKNIDYTKRKDNKAVASFWIKNYSELVNKTMLNSLGTSFIRKNKLGKIDYGIDGAWGNLYLENGAARLIANMSINKDWVKSYKRMYKAKMDPAFFNHFDQDNVLAYASISFNMQNMLEEYPTIFSKMYGEIMPKYNEEIILATDVISLLLDEKAIGKTITGNMLFILNNIAKKEVAYTTYEYDDNYNSTEVTKTKMETIPDFTIMIGSKNKNLITKIIRLGAKHKLVDAKANYYKMNEKNDLPFDLFFIVKNEIAFLTTSKQQILDIATGKSVKNYGKHKKLIRKNSSVFYANGKKIAHEVPREYAGRNKKLLDFAKENVSELYFTTSKVKRKKIQFELRMNTSKKYDNSLKYFMSFFDILID